MSLYHFHLHECGKVSLDEEGHEVASIEQAREEAIRAARGIMCSEVASGHLCLACYILIENDQQDEVLRVQFKDAISLSGLGDLNS